MHLRAAVLFLLALVLLGQQKKPVTVEALLETPRTALSPVWAPDGKRFASLEQGRLWMYDAATGTRTELLDTALPGAKAVKPSPPAVFNWPNRRVIERPVQWFPSGSHLLLAVSGDLFLVNAATGAWEQLTATADAERDAKLSPDARWVVFRRGHDLWAMETAGRKVRRLTRDGSATLLNGELDWVYPEELELSTAFWWSPDSTRVAFLQFDVSREPLYPHAWLQGVFAVFEPQRFPQPGTPNADLRLGVTDLSGRVRWMDLGEPRDRLFARFHWSPDSRSLAVVRLNRVQNRLDLLVVDASTGHSRVVLREEDPAWINVRDEFRFLDGGRRFLWGSERDGFRHLYVYGLDGRQEARLTQGDWEVTSVAGVNQNAREVYYVSTEESPLERHLYAVGLDGGNRRRLTTTRGVHTVSLAPGCARYVDTVSNRSTPPSTTLRELDGKPIAVLREPPAQEYALLPVEIVEFAGQDGTRFYGRLIKPAGLAPDRKYPVVVVIYGGPHAQSVQDVWRGANIDQYLAARGFVIWQMDNRGGGGRGHRWETSVNRNLGRRELDDQLEGLRYLARLGFADMARVGIYGWSYGGYMTLYAMTNAPDVFKAGAAGAPVADWRLYDSIYTERYMGLPSENPEGYRRSSPVHTASALRGQLLLLHNLEDDNVHFQNTMQMAAALQTAGKQFSMMIYPQRTHGVTGALRKHLYETIAAFFEKNL